MIKESKTLSSSFMHWLFTLKLGGGFFDEPRITCLYAVNFSSKNLHHQDLSKRSCSAWASKLVNCSTNHLSVPGKTQARSGDIKPGAFKPRNIKSTVQPSWQVRLRGNKSISKKYEIYLEEVTMRIVRECFSPRNFYGQVETGAMGDHAHQSTSIPGSTTKWLPSTLSINY